VSLLDRASITITVYPEVTTLDEDGNTLLKPGPPYEAQAVIQPQRQSGTSARRAEQDDEGYFTEEVYRLRFTREHDRTHPVLGQGSEIEWDGSRWSLVGMATRYLGSNRTAHIDYQIRRN
jgi:hypothetical protein